MDFNSLPAEVREAIAKAQPSVGDVHINRPLTDLSIAFQQEQMAFVADRVFPAVPVRKQANQYSIYAREDWYRIEAQRRAPGTESAGSGWNLSRDTYFAHTYALHKDIDEETRENADDEFNIDEDATRYVTTNLMMLREQIFVNAYFAPGIWSVSAAPGTLWDAVGSTPIEDIRARKTNILGLTGYEPNILVLGARVWSILQDHPEFTARISGGSTNAQPAMVNLALLAQILELDEVMVTKAVTNSANEGATEATDFIGGRHALLAYRAPNPGLLQPSAGYTFEWTGFTGASRRGTRFKRFTMDQLNSDRVEGESRFDMKLVASDLGTLFENAVS